MLPKRRFWKANLTVRNIFSTHLSTFLSPNRVLTPLEKCFENAFRTVRLAFQNLRLVAIKWLPRFGYEPLQSASHGNAFWKVGSDGSTFQHLRLGIIKFPFQVYAPKRRFWKAGRTFQNAVSKHFSRVWVLYLGYKTLKSASKPRSETFVRPSKIFV